MVKGITSLGRQKIKISLIKKKEARQVCFSKRRQGLFKNARPSPLAIPPLKTASSVTSNVSGTSSSSHNSGDWINIVESFNELQAGQQELLEIEMERKERLKEVIQREMSGRAIELLDANKEKLRFQDLTKLCNELEAINGEIVNWKMNQGLEEAWQLTSPSSDNGFIDGHEVNGSSLSSSDSSVTSLNDQKSG
ncbi:hypothetical protein ACP4OV_016767 [Aristida adscensionis]